MTTHATFSVPVYISDVDEDERIAIKSLIDNFDFDFQKGSSFGLESDVGITDISANFFKLGNFNFLESVIYKHLKNYLSDVNSEISSFEIDAAWVTKTLPREVITPHNHRDADISCVYYIKTNGEDGDLALYSPNPAIDASRWINQGSLYKIKPKEGQIVFFPSWILHSTTINNTEYERISIAIDLVAE